MSFHTINPYPATPANLKSQIQAIVASNGSARWAWPSLQAGMPPAQWAAIVHAADFTTGSNLADKVAALLDGNPPGSPVPTRVIIDELKPSTVAKIATMANILRGNRPQYAGRWGVYIAHWKDYFDIADPEPTPWDYTSLTLALSELFTAGAFVPPEMYGGKIKKSEYMTIKNAYGSAAADIWLASLFTGYTGGAGSYGNGWNWLVAYRNTINGSCYIYPIFGAGDGYDGNANDTFLDRNFYVWITRSGYPGSIWDFVGGPGSYKWESPWTTRTARDDAFISAYLWYCVAPRQTSSLLGPVV